MAELNIDLRYGRFQPSGSPLGLSQNLRQLAAVGHTVRPPASGSQQTVVAGVLGSGPSTARFLEYLQHGKGRDGVDAALYSARDRTLDLQAFAAAAAHDPHQFRIAVSLGQTEHFFALQPFIESLMAQVGHDLRRPIDWLAASHYDTAHPHAHILLRGKDRAGDDLYIQNDYLTYGMRYRADGRATMLLGLQRAAMPVIALQREYATLLKELSQQDPGSVEITQEPREPQLTQDLTIDQRDQAIAASVVPAVVGQWVDAARNAGEDATVQRYTRELERYTQEHQSSDEATQALQVRQTMVAKLRALARPSRGMER
jgi:hypothetical protein